MCTSFESNILKCSFIIRFRAWNAIVLRTACGLMMARVISITKFVYIFYNHCLQMKSEIYLRFVLVFLF
ncbi:hypothetical protein DOY81_009534, partial [Sarcophaga bullata]